MAILKLARGAAQGIVWGEHDRAKIVQDTITGTSRWSIKHRLIFKLDGKMYEVAYSVGATEAQDEQPFEYAEEVSCVEVEPYEKTVTEFRPI